MGVQTNKVIYRHLIECSRCKQLDYCNDDKICQRCIRNLRDNRYNLKNKCKADLILDKTACSGLSDVRG